MDEREGHRRGAPFVEIGEAFFQDQKVVAMNRNLPNDAQQHALRIAFKRLDPDSILVPGTREYEESGATVIKWIRMHGTDRALQMVEESVKILKDVKKSL